MTETARISNGKEGPVDPVSADGRSSAAITLYRAVKKALFSISESTVTCYALLLLIAIALLDYITGYEIAFSVFYVAPVALTAWRARFTLGLLMCLLSATVWGMIDYTSGHQYSSNLILLWNSAVRLAFFGIIALLLSDLREKMDLLDRLARIDPLTGILNSRAFFEMAVREIEQFKRYGGSFTLLFIDLDNFKTVNDRFGHAVGDELLRTLIMTMHETLRTTDIIGRVGGDEFVVWLTHSSGNEARETIERLQRTVAGAMSSRGWPVTMSIGAVSVPHVQAGVDLKVILRKADLLMYQVKNSSKNGLLVETLDS